MSTKAFLTTEYDFNNQIKYFLDKIKFCQRKDQKFKTSMELFEYLLLDNYWLYAGGKYTKFVNCVKSKLKELSRTNPEYKQFYHNFEERLGFAKYCKGTTLNNLPCFNQSRKCSNLCYIHAKKYDSILNYVSDVIYIKDLAKIITDQVI